MFARLARLVTTHRRTVLILAFLAFVVSGALGGGVASKLSSGGFETSDSEVARANRLLATEFDTGTPNVVLVVTARSGTVDSADVAAAGKALATKLRAETYDGVGIVEALSYWDLPSGNPLGSTNHQHALIVARFADDDTKLVEFSKTLPAKYVTQDGPVQVRLAGSGPLFASVNTTVEDDLLRAEMIAVPITLILLLFIFRGVVAALLPLVVGGLSVVGTFLVLLIVNSFTPVSVFALNLTTAMGLGLAIDYALFIVSRYREELVDHEPLVAVRRTVATAGRTVLFSAMTVAASLLALLVFDIPFLRSFAYAGVAVSLLAGLYATVVLPALLAVLGRRVDALRVGRRLRHRSADEGYWHRMATLAMRRPVPIVAGILVVLLVLGAPTRGLRLGLPDDRVMPPGSTTRQASDLIRTQFSSEETSAASVVLAGVGSKADRAATVDALAKKFAALPDVARVDAETGLYCGSLGEVSGIPCNPGTLAVPAALAAQLTARFSAEDSTYLSVVPSVEPVSAAGEQFVKRVRAVDPGLNGGAMLVGGPSASLVDAKASLFADMPLALGIIAAITFVLLFLMFGSVLVPIKALVLNILSLSATFGAMVWIFQEGHGAKLLDFTATGSLSAVIPVLMFCVAFGLSMDYEVFLLSRIKEEHDHGADNITSVARGLERTGRIVTAAALLMSVVFLAFATSAVSFLKLFGLGLTVAVLLDAFVIRGTLVPAFMRLAGNANWWAPAPLRRIYERFGIHEHVELVDEPAASDTPAPERAKVAT